ncbi:DNA replication complex GINS protein psf3 [Cunninghamella echinulata]|nr:DNA replication complex GINS protein psf3 [Cunninghamella echinulata]
MEDDEYYDIDSILAEHTKMPCVIQRDIDAETNLSGDGTDLPRGSRVELPFWLSKALAQLTLEGNETMIQIELPKAFGMRVRNALDASPTAVDYRLLCPFFYIFGHKLLDLLVVPELAPVLENAFKLRLRSIMDYSQSGAGNIGQEFLQKLDETEKELFKSSQDSASQLRQWYNKKVYRLDYKSIK